MANEEHVDFLKKGVDAWNTWRRDNSRIVPDLSGTDLKNARLSEINFQDVNLIYGLLNKS